MIRTEDVFPIPRKDFSLVVANSIVIELLAKNLNYFQVDESSLDEDRMVDGCYVVANNIIDKIEEFLKKRIEEEDACLEEARKSPSSSQVD